MASLLAAQQLLTSSNSGLSAAQQQQLLASMSSSLSQLSTSQQQQLLASLMGSSNMTGMTGSGRDGSSGVSGLTPAQQQLLAAAGTSLTSVSGGRKDFSSRSSTPTSRDMSGLSRPQAPSTPTGLASLSIPSTNGALDPASQTKYQQLLSVIEEMSKDIR